MIDRLNKELWEAMQRYREILIRRGALCTNCGCLLDPENPHMVQGWGWCTIPD